MEQIVDPICVDTDRRIRRRRRTPLRYGVGNGGWTSVSVAIAGDVSHIFSDRLRNLQREVGVCSSLFSWAAFSPRNMRMWKKMQLQLMIFFLNWTEPTGPIRDFEYYQHTFALPLLVKQHNLPFSYELCILWKGKFFVKYTSDYFVLIHGYNFIKINNNWLIF